MIEAHDLCRRYGEFTAVEGISFAAQEGEILGMLGPNGAGKTTTIRMVTGFLPPTEGQIRVAGKDLATEPLAARREIGYLPENVSLYPEMRVGEYLSYRARLEGMGRAEAARALGETIERCFIEEVREQIIGTLSKGYRQRVALATAILHQPRVLVLDEPTVGLDPKQIVEIRALIRELGERRTLLLSTHILPEVELLCHRVVIIDRGRIVDQGTPDTLRQRWRGNTVLRVTVKDPPSDAGELLAGLDGALAVRPHAGTPGCHLLECAPGRDLREAVFRAAAERGWVLLELAEQKASLEDVFVRLTTREPAAGAGEPESAPQASVAAAEAGSPSAGDGGGPAAPPAADGGGEAGR